MDIGIIILAVVALIVGAFLFARTRESKPKDFSDEKQTLEEIEIYTAYGRTEQAIKLLETALTAVPDSDVYKQKLAELRSKDN